VSCAFLRAPSNKSAKTTFVEITQFEAHKNGICILSVSGLIIEFEIFLKNIFGLKVQPFFLIGSLKPLLEYKCINNMVKALK
jgi:hypothetical protein